MILEVYVLFVVLAVILIGVGLFHKEAVHSLIGFTFLFILGIILTGGVGVFNSHVFFESGQNITQLNSTFTQVAYTYSDLTTEGTTLWFGRFLAIAGVLGFAAVLFDLKSFIKSGRDTTFEVEKRT